MVIASKIKNGKTITRQFSPIAWKLLGSNKEGWTAVDSQVVTSNVKAKPETGEKEEAKKPVTEKTVSNLEKTKAEKVESNLTEKSEIDEQAQNNELADEQEKKKIEFMTEASKITKGAIKDYFDKNSIKYDNKAKEEALQEQLSVVFENDLQALKLVF